MEFDLLLLRRAFEVPGRDVFDTVIASRMLGLREFSMTPGAIGVAKEVLADLRADELRVLARRILQLPTVDDIERELVAALGRFSLIRE